MARNVTPLRPTPAIVAFPTAARALLRRPRREPGTLLLVLVVCIASLVLSSAPRFAGRVTDDGLQQALVAALPQQAGISTIIQGRIGVSGTGDSFADIAQRGEEYRAGLAPAIQDIISDSTYLVESPPFAPVDATGAPLLQRRLQYPTFRFRYENAVWERVELVAGRLPVRREPQRPSEALGYPLASAHSPTPVDSALRYIEVVMTPASAASLQLALNDKLVLEPSPSASLPAGTLNPRLDSPRVIIELVGLIEIKDPADPVWFGDAKLLRPEITHQRETVFIAVSVLGAEDEAVYSDLYLVSKLTSRDALNWTYAWRYRVDPTRVDAQTLPALQEDLRNLETTRGPLDTLFDDPFESLVRTGLPGIIEGVLERKQLLTTALALAAIGLLGLALALTGLVSKMLVERRRSTLLLMRSRGATGAQILAAELMDSLLFCLPAALLGFVLAQLLVVGPATGWSLVAALGVGTGAVLVRVGATLPIVRPPLGRLQREQPQLRPPLQRLVFDALVVVLAVVGLVLLRRRGLASEVDAGSSLPFDPYLAAVPVLLGCAVGLLTLRLVPLPLEALARVAARGRGVVAMLGLRRVSRQQAAGALPAIVTIIAVALAIFALGLASSIGQAQEDDAWRTTGADYRVDASAGASAALDLIASAGISGTEETALAATLPGARYRGGQNLYLLLPVVAVEPDAYAAVVRGTPAERTFPAAFSGVSPAEGVPLPALASPAFLAAQNLRVGDTILLEPGGYDLNLTIVGTLTDFPGVTNAQFVLVAYEQLAELTEQNGVPFQPTSLFVRGRPGLADDLRSAAGEFGTNDQLAIATRTDALAANRDSAFSLGVTDGFRLTVVLAAFYAALAIIVVQILTLSAHARDLAYLRTLGLSTRQAFMLSLIEHVPATLLAGVIGALLGVVLLHLVEPALPLEAFTSASATATVTAAIPLWPAIALTGAILLGVFLALLIFTLATWRTRYTRIVRAGE